MNAFRYLVQSTSFLPMRKDRMSNAQEVNALVSERHLIGTLKLAAGDVESSEQICILDASRSVPALSDMNHGFDHSSCWIEPIGKHMRHLFHGCMMGDPRLGVDRTCVDQLNDACEIL